MMLCKADFEELFPETFKLNQCHVAPIVAGDPGPACLARWEDDGGRPSGQPRRRDAPVVRPARHGYAVSDPMMTGLALATMPAAAAYGAAWTMLSGFGQTTRV